MKWEPSFTPRWVNKKAALNNFDLITRVKQHGYHIPPHWKDITKVREFVAWDGEGVTHPGNVQQSYVLFGSSAGSYITGEQLSTLDCLDLLIETEKEHPDAIHVGFAIGYDINMILADLDYRHLVQIYRKNRTTWKGYKLEWIPGKWLNVRRDNVTLRLFDVWGFFQASFIAACTAFLGRNNPDLTRIIEGKQARGSFTMEQLEPLVIPYWKNELVLLVDLINHLRDSLVSANLKIKSWHGPGAVANEVFRSHGVKKAMAECPTEVQRASQFAYAGGRFELFQAGHYNNRVYQYDIRSAYPTAIALLPSLVDGNWEEVNAFEPNTFSVWNVEYLDNRVGKPLFIDPQPLFFRQKNGAVSFPSTVEGWYWCPEASLISPSAIKHGYVYRQLKNSKLPFSFVPKMYAQRAQWKASGNDAQMALKLALNSLYGKMAQRVGSTLNKKPTWHQLEWAGFVTSYTRSSLFRAMSLAPDAIIAVETDGIFSMKPLDLDFGEGLGQWEVIEHEWITYLQSGLYFSNLGEKYRGFDKGSISYNDVRRFLETGASLSGITTRFNGIGTSLITSRMWRAWETDTRKITFGGDGKRSHLPSLCSSCARGVGLGDGLHELAVTTVGGRSYPHPLPWNLAENSEKNVWQAIDRRERWS